MPNFLWVNLGPPADAPSGAPRFVEMALDLGVALGGEGFPEGSMGIAAGDPDGDGDEDLLLTHFTLQKNTFYRNLGGVFQDQTASVGLEWPSRPWTGFGVGWLELDGDGWLDLFVANGAVHSLEDRVALGDPYPLRQRNQVFLNRAGRGFDEATARAGSGLELLDVSRGAAFGDLDDDGDLDIVVANNNGPARVLRNDLLPARAADVAWLGLDLRQPLASGRTRPALLARADLRLADGRTITRWSRADGSYASSADPRILFHWPAAGPAPVALRITWPGRGGGVPAEVALPGSAEGKAPLLGRYHRVVEGVPSDLTVPAARGE